MRMVYLTLVDVSGKSGENHYSRQVSLALARDSRLELTLICPKPKRTFPPEYSELGVEYHFLPAKKSRSLGWLLRVQPYLFHLIRRQHRYAGGLDGVVTTLKPGLFALPLINWLFGIPQVLLVEGLMARNVAHMLDLPGSGFAANCVAWLNIRLSIQTYVAYEAVRDWLTDVAPSSQSRIKVFQNGVNLERFRPIRRKIAQSEIGLVSRQGDLTVGFVGSFKSYHCVDVLLEAAARTFSSGVKLLLVGDGPEIPRLRRMVERLGLQGSVHFTGYVEHHDVPAYICSCDVLYGVRDPSYWGNPMKIYEYLACGRPVIALRAREFMFIEDLNAGILIDVPHVDSVESALDRFNRMDHKTRLEMGRRGAECVRASRKWTCLVDNIVENILQSMI